MTLTHKTITPIPNTKPDAVPELWNARYREVDQNFQGLDNRQGTVEETVAEHCKRIGAIENQSVLSVTQALRLDWLYRDLQIELELFFASWTLLDPMTNVVTDAVAGDDSMDLDSIAGLVPGKEYVIFDGDNQESVIITEILNATRVRVASNLLHPYSNALLRRTSWSVTDGKAVAGDGGIYLAGPVNMGDENSDKTVVIRRDRNDAFLQFYFKDAAHTAWTRVFWAWEREITSGVIDLEYSIPARGTFDLKIVNSQGKSGIDPAIYHIACVDNATGLRGIHHPPLTPSIVYPLSGAIDIDEQPSLTTTAYAHPCKTTLCGSEFQVSSNADFADGNIIDESGVVDGVSYFPAKDVLAVSTMYYVRARHIDVFSGISDWSDASSFTTKLSYVTVNKPTCVSPTASEELNSPDGLTLVSSGFSTEGGSDTHASSRWQIASDPAFTSIVYDSNETTNDKISHNVPDGIVERGKTYYWRVKHKGSAEGWSDWSNCTLFSVISIANGVRVDGGIAVGPYTFADGQTGYLIVAPASKRQASTKWGLYNTDVGPLNNLTSAGSADPHTGEYNTGILISASYSNNTYDGGNTRGCPAANYCANLTFENQSDFFLPNKEELATIIAAKNVIDAADDTAGSKFSTIGSTPIWSSSEYNVNLAWVQNPTGSQDEIAKLNEYWVIPCRRLIL
jgi:hypothetical protein